MDNSQYKLWDEYWRTYRISIEDAIQIALQQIPYQIVDIKLDMENGGLVYEIYIRTPIGMYQVKIDTKTGKVLEVNEIYE